MKTKTELLLEADFLFAEILTKKQEYEKLKDEKEGQLNSHNLPLFVEIATLTGRIEGLMWAIGSDNETVRTPEPKIKRSQESMRKHFFTAPGDVFTIRHTSNCVSDSIAIHIINAEQGDDFWISMTNHQKSWKCLKEIGELASRTVLFQIDETDPIPYIDSVPYTHRFKN